MKKCIFLIVLFIVSCDSTNSIKDATSEEKRYRPAFHFTPQNNWMNDPNGMFYLNGTYHLYFQYYPSASVWGPMHWGHATSEDMVHWKEQPIALFPDEQGYIFSGSAVVDHQNTSGFGTEGKTPVIAIFTHHNRAKEAAEKMDVETQSIAYSLNEGMTWTKYKGNPVIKNPAIRDFRDPKVFWDDKRLQWILVLSAQKKVMFYRSPNLKEWELLSDFGENIGHHGGVWECPDLFPLTVVETGETKWVLLVSINPGGPNGGSATQYFIGDFDGKTFTLDKEFDTQLHADNNYWVDFGRDNYAGVTWQNTQQTNGNKLFIGWMSNWNYAMAVPTYAWRSAMTIARELELHHDEKSYRLHSIPVDKLATHFSEKLNLTPTTISGEKVLVNQPHVDLHRSRIDFSLKLKRGTEFEFSLSNGVNNCLEFGLDPTNNNFYIDRTRSGQVNFSERFAHRISFAPRLSEEKTIHATLYIDKTSIEIFWDNGKNVMTEIFFPEAPYTQLSLRTSDDVKLVNFTLAQLK